MVSKADARVTVNVGGVERRLFSLYERPDCAMTVILRAGSRLLDIDNQVVDKKIMEQRYSIHRSLASSDNVSTIKFTMRFENDTRHETYHPTRVLSERSGFAPLFVKRCPDFKDIRYDLKTQNMTSIGRLDSDFFLLFFTVFVSDKSVTFLPNLLSIVNRLILPFQHMNIVVLWVFCAIPAAPTGQLANLMNPFRRQHQVAFPAVLTANGCITEFMQIAEIMVQNFLQVLASIYDAEKAMRIERSAIFYKQGIFDNDQHEAHWRLTMSVRKLRNHWHWSVL